MQESAIRDSFDILVEAVPRPALLAILVIFFISPFVGVGFLGTEIMIFAIAVIGFDILIGYTGYVSFGQALFFGAGAYTAAFGVEYIGLSFLSTLFVAVVSGIVIAVVVGALSFQRRGVYFALLTLAFAQMVWTLGFVRPDITGGNEGFGFSRPMMDLGFTELSMNGNIPMFLFTFLLASLALYLAIRIVESPFGQVILAIRENEERVIFLGYNTFYYKILSFTIAGAYAALAGGLYALFTRFAFLELLFWEMSGNLLMMVLIGGLGTIYGPVIGTYLFIIFRDTLSAMFTEWPIVLGAIFVLIILFTPDGLMGIYARASERVQEIVNRE